MKGYRRKVREDKEGGRPLYREAHDGERDRYMGKISASSKWFKNKKSNLVAAETPERV